MYQFGVKEEEYFRGSYLINLVAVSEVYVSLVAQLPVENVRRSGNKAIENEETIA
jgi:hypothetical protein